jgi:hypothetical protein
MRTVFILALIVAAPICSGDASETKRLEEEDENTKISCHAEDKTNTSTPEWNPAKWSKADQKYYIEIVMNAGDERLRLRKIGERARREKGNSKYKSLLDKLREREPQFTPEDKVAVRLFLRESLELKEDTSDNVMGKLHSDVEWARSYFLDESFMVEINEGFDTMYILRRRVLGWKWPWELEGPPQQTAMHPCYDG